MIATDYRDRLRDMGDNQVSKSKFKAKTREHFRLLESSTESVMVTDDGKPVLEVRHDGSVERNPVDILRGSVVRYQNSTDPVAVGDWEAAR